MYNLKMAIIKRRNMQLYLMQKILYILPINIVVSDQYTRFTLVTSQNTTVMTNLMIGTRKVSKLGIIFSVLVIVGQSERPLYTLRRSLYADLQHYSLNDFGQEKCLEEEAQIKMQHIIFGVNFLYISHFSRQLNGQVRLGQVTAHAHGLLACKCLSFFFEYFPPPPPPQKKMTSSFKRADCSNDLT